MPLVDTNVPWWRTTHAADRRGSRSDRDRSGRARQCRIAWEAAIKTAMGTSDLAGAIQRGVDLSGFRRLAISRVGRTDEAGQALNG